MLSGLKMWVPVILAIVWTLYLNEWSKQISYKLMTGDISGAYELYQGEVNEKNEDSNDTIGNSDKLFTREELAEYKNLKNGLYIAIVGKVFDVSKGEQHYGDGGTYHAFTGRDASKAFITGDFSADGLSDDLSGVTVTQAKAMDDWVKIYHEKYEYKGKLIGRYYDGSGKATQAFRDYEQKVIEAKKEKTGEEEQKRKYPPCNIEWKAEQGTRVWCTDRSGGILRNWIGVPRQYFEDVKSDKHRCACVDLKSPIYSENMGRFREYENCASDSTSCIIIKHEVLNGTF